MYKIVRKSRAIQGVILLFTLLVMITIFPVRMWEETIPSVSNQVLSGYSDSVGEDYLLQRFIAQYDHLGTVNLYIADFENGRIGSVETDTFLFRMFDSNMQIMFEQSVDVSFVDIPGFCPIYINTDLEVGRDYYFFVQGINGSRAWFGLEETKEAGTQYVSRLVYNYEELEGYNIVGEYYYKAPLRKDKILAYDAVLLLIAALLTGAVELYFRISKRDKLIVVEKAFRYTANILTASVTGVSLYIISIRRFFSGQFEDNLFYTIGTLLFAATLFYAVNRKRDRSKYIPLAGRLKENAVDYLQIVFIAGAIWACCNYMNGLYDIHHRIAERQFMVFFAFVIITMFKKKEILSKVTFCYALAAAAAVYRYHSIYVDYLAMGELDLKALRYGIAVVVLGGFIIVNIMVRIAVMLIRIGRKDTSNQEKMGRISVWYGAVLALFFVLIVLFRNTRWWIVALVVSFTLFYIYYALWDKKGHLLKNMCNGLLVHFICTAVFVLLHRPFLSWIYPRFPFIFHTVTITAVYLTFVMCAALMKLTDKYGESHRLKDIWKELAILGISGTYMLFTASRTGLLAVAVMTAVAVVMAVGGAGWEKVSNILRLLGLMAVSIIWCFPIIFTGQRIIPAVYNDVYKYEVEKFPDAVTRENEWDSMYFITVERFVAVFNYKIFGIPENGDLAYKGSEEYQKYRVKKFASASNIGEASIDVKAQQLEMIGAGTKHTESGEDAAGVSDTEQITGFEEAEEAQETAAEGANVYGTTEEYANGRMDIFRAYIEQLNLKGHDEMGALLPDGTLAVHAHNIYLQIAYDSGIIVGIVFIALGAATFVQACIFYKRRKDEVPCAAMPAAVVTAFAAAGLVEWIFHLCHPAGFTLLVVIAPLLFDMGEKRIK